MNIFMILYFSIRNLYQRQFGKFFLQLSRKQEFVEIGVKSTAILFGDLDRLMIGILQVSALLGFLLLGIELGYQHLYYVGLALMAGLFAYQGWLIRDRQRDACFEAFRNNIWVGVCLLLGTLFELLIGAWLL